MAMFVQVRNWRDEVLHTFEDSERTLIREIARHYSTDMVVLRFIDSDGYTMLNALQIPVFIEELKNLINISDENSREDLGIILRLAEMSLELSHLYLWFDGD